MELALLKQAAENVAFSLTISRRAQGGDTINLL
jgi:hypothetical protein